MSTENNNPYQPPSSELGSGGLDANTGDFSFTGVNKLPAGRGLGWIVDGFNLFKANPGVWLLIALVYLIIVIVLTVIPFIGSLALNIINPVFIAGIMLGCAAIYKREDISVGHLFKGFSIPQTGRLCLAGLLYLALIFGFMLVFGLVAAMFFGVSGGLENMLLSGGFSIGMVILFLVLMLAFIPIFMMMYYAPPLIALSDLSITEAFSCSFKGCLKNMWPFLVYGIIAFGLMILAVIPLGLGLFVLVPVLFGSMFISYKEIFTSA